MRPLLKLICFSLLWASLIVSLDCFGALLTPRQATTAATSGIPMLVSVPPSNVTTFSLGLRVSSFKYASNIVWQTSTDLKTWSNVGNSIWTNNPAESFRGFRLKAFTNS